MYKNIVYACCIGNLDAIRNIVNNTGFDLRPLMHDYLLYSQHFEHIQTYLKNVETRHFQLEENFKAGKYFELSFQNSKEKDDAFHWACHNGDFDAVQILCNH